MAVTRRFVSDFLKAPRPPEPPPTRPVPKPPRPSKKQQEHTKRTINMLLLRSHVALTYSPHEGSSQALRYADRAYELALAHHLHEHRGKAQWYRGEALMELRRWKEANSAIAKSPGLSSPRLAMSAHGAKGSGSGHGGFDPNRFAIRTRKNNEQIVTFVVAMAVITSIVVLAHWLRALISKSSLTWRSPLRPITYSARLLRRTFIRSMPILPSIGHGSLVAVYLTLNVCIAFTNTDPALTTISNFGSRMAWMAIVNLCVVVILALKNTPLALISPWSYERLNILHQVSGCMTLIFTILHAALYTVNFTSQGRPERLLETEEIYGMVAGLSFLLVSFAGMVVRRWWYEAFYYLHITFWVLGLVMIGMHQPELAKKVLYVVAALGGIWVLDRAIRLARLAVYGTNNHAVLTPLSNGATRITMNKTPFASRPGKHCFLWIPRIRPTETHPFTIVSTSPLEFVVTSHDGFTAALHRYAQANPNSRLRASLDGPYGTLPEATKFDKVILVAGGSGITFTLGIAMDLLKSAVSNVAKEVTFVWVVKEKACLSWFTNQLNCLQADSRFRVKLYVTREASQETTVSMPLASSSPLSIPDSPVSDPEKDGVTALTRPGAWRTRTLSSSREAASLSELASPLEDMDPEIHRVDIQFTRPKIVGLLDEALLGAVPSDRVLVMACGPAGLTHQVRESTAKRIVDDGPSIELHCESFGW
ncbi:ferric reductase NAD binding domain-containing protein [Sarocladium implicatum]|nr:ferric reductase NAD binding domain-containing protein [Sarocladium implicatum]